jgi:hypothetical protein
MEGRIGAVIGFEDHAHSPMGVEDASAVYTAKLHAIDRTPALDLKWKQGQHKRRMGVRRDSQDRLNITP